MFKLLKNKTGFYLAFLIVVITNPALGQSDNYETISISVNQDSVGNVFLHFLIKNDTRHKITIDPNQFVFPERTSLFIEGPKGFIKCTLPFKEHELIENYILKKGEEKAFEFKISYYWDMKEEGDYSITFYYMLTNNLFKKCFLDFRI